MWFKREAKMRPCLRGERKIVQRHVLYFLRPNSHQVIVVILKSTPSKSVVTSHELNCSRKKNQKNNNLNTNANATFEKRKTFTWEHCQQGLCMPPPPTVKLPSISFRTQAKPSLVIATDIFCSSSTFGKTEKKKGKSRKNKMKEELQLRFF